MKRNPIRHYAKKIISLATCLVLMTFHFHAFGQFGRNTKSVFPEDEIRANDTSSKSQIALDDHIRILEYTLADTFKRMPDSSILTLQQNPLLNSWQFDLGNFASASQSIFFDPVMDASLHLGLNALQSNLFLPKQIKYYNTTRPYTDAFYRIGTKQEQLIHLIHTQNVKPNWNVAINYRKIGSPGSYKLQKTNNDNASVSTNYISSNQRYQLHGSLVYNKIQQDENGGIIDENYLLYANYNDKRLIPVSIEAGSTGVNRSSITNYYRNLSLNLQQQYFIGKADSLYNIDSTEKIYSFKPIFGIRHTLYTNFDKCKYKDMRPDSSFYAQEGSFIFGNNDSVYSTTTLHQIGNSFSLLGNITVHQKTLQSEAGYGLEVESIFNGLYEKQYLNNYVFANLKKESSQAKEWIYDAALQIYFTGNAIGNFNLHGQAGRNFSKKIGDIKVGLVQCVQTAPYLFTQYQTNFFTSTHSFNKQSISKLFLQYNNDFRRVHANLHYFLIGNYLYRDSNFHAVQYDKVFPLIQLQAQNEFRVSRFALQNILLFQQVSNTTPVHVPAIAARHILSYNTFIFKKKLQISTGLEVHWNTRYNADNYSPIYFGFGNQYSRLISNFPQCSYFFNFKVKRYRASIAFNELQQIFTRNNINYSHYAAQNFSMHFGFHWVFIN